MSELVTDNKQDAILKESEVTVSAQIEQITNQVDLLERERLFWGLIDQLMSTQQFLLSRLRKVENR